MADSRGYHPPCPDPMDVSYNETKDIGYCQTCGAEAVWEHPPKPRRVTVELSSRRDRGKAEDDRTKIRPKKR